MQPICDTRSIFKQSTAGLNSEFSFFYMGCLTNLLVAVKFDVYSYLLCIYHSATDRM